MVKMKEGVTSDGVKKALSTHDFLRDSVDPDAAVVGISTDEFFDLYEEIVQG